MGVPGVALATIIAQGISAVLCLFKLLSMKEHFELNWSMLRVDKRLAMQVVKLGLPPVLPRPSSPWLSSLSNA